MAYNHFDMKHDMLNVLESCAQKALEQWLQCCDKEQSEELLEMMRFYVEAAEVYSSIDSGKKARWSCAQAYGIGDNSRNQQVVPRNDLLLST